MQVQTYLDLTMQEQSSHQLNGAPAELLFLSPKQKRTNNVLSLCCIQMFIMFKELLLLIKLIPAPRCIHAHLYQQQLLFANTGSKLLVRNGCEEPLEHARSCIFLCPSENWCCSEILDAWTHPESQSTELRVTGRHQGWF